MPEGDDGPAFFAIKFSVWLPIHWMPPTLVGLRAGGYREDSAQNAPQDMKGLFVSSHEGGCR